MSRTLTVLLLSLPMLAVAETDPLVGDRPDFTESAATIAPGRVQIEAGYTRSEVEETTGDSAGEVLVRVGLGENTEARLGLGGWLRAETGGQDVSGLGDPSLGVKQRLMAGEGSVPELALLAATTLPVGAEEVGAEEAEPSLTAAAAWSLGARTGLGVNLGWASRSAGDDRFDSAWMSASVAYAAGDRLGVFAEAYGFDREESGGDSTGYADVGVTYLLNPDLQLDVRLGRGFNGLDEDRFAGVGVVARF